MADRVRANIMISRSLRAACAALCLFAFAALNDGNAQSSASQVDAVRRQYVQALQRGDINAAERYEKELRALESRTPIAASLAASPATPSASATSTFFSAPAGRAAVAPGDTSTVFNAPTAPPPGLAGPSFSPSSPRSSPAASTSPSLATGSAPTSKPPPLAPSPPVVSPTAPLGAGAAATRATIPTSSGLGFSASTPLATEEPRPVELPPGVLDAKEAQAVLSKLEGFRMAESQTSRRSTGLSPEPTRPAPAPLSASPVAMPPAAAFPPVAPASVASTVNLSGAPDDLRRRLDDLTRRKSELQNEAEKLAKENADWEARYNAAKAELARIETENKSADRLQSIRSEIGRLDTDSTQLMQDIEAVRANQERSAREVLTRSGTPTAVTLPRLDRPVIPATPAPPSTEPERKGPPQFKTASSTRGTSGGSTEGNIVRTGRTGADSVALQRELDRLTERKESILREIDEVQVKFQAADREFAMANRTGQQADMDRLSRDKSSLDARFKTAQADLMKVDAEIQAKVGEFKSAMGAGDPNMAAAGDAIQIIVAEDDSFNGVYSVKRDGNIILPRVGRVAVAGRDISEVEAAVKALLEETQLTKATVTADFKSKAQTPTGAGVGADDPVIIYLAGEFITPGPLKMPPGVAPTLITTIIRSGGITPSGDLTRTKLLRIENGQGAVEEVNVAAILSGNIPPTDIALNPGDIIMIPAFAPVVYVTGNINKPGTLRLFQDETLTAYAAILRAGGFSRFANLKKCSVVRELGNGEKIQMPLNVKEIQKGLAPDIVLQGKDIVVVPESFFSF